MSDATPPDSVSEGLTLQESPDAEQLARERALLDSVADAPLPARMRTYWSLIGPGYMQSAMTLGGGTASAALFSGALFGYALLWVPPVAMLLGIVMLAAISYQTLSTGRRPYQAMRQYAGTPFAAAWAFGALAASIIWHFPQYALASAVMVDIADVLGWPDASPVLMGILVLAWAILISSMYGRSNRWIRHYERLIKYMVWGIIACFGFVVLSTGISDWNALARGFLAFEIPDSRNGVAAATLVVSGLAAAMGINMVFLYPYSLLARGWRREHRPLARFDLALGMLLPYVIAASLITVAAANTIHIDAQYDGTRLSPVQAAQSLSAVIGPTLGRIVFGLGVLAMALSTITLHMLAAGFVCAEVFGWSLGSRNYRLATLLPVPGVLGCVYWRDIAVWLAVPTNIVCGLFLPAAYVGFILLQRNRAYLGDATPSGTKAIAWLGAMIATTAFLVAFFAWYLVSNGPAYVAGLFG